MVLKTASSIVPWHLPVSADLCWEITNRKLITSIKFKVNTYNFKILKRGMNYLTQHLLCYKAMSQ